MKNILLGADVGGSHITTALIDLTSGQLLKDTLKRNSVNSLGTAEEIFTSWVSSINDSFGDYSGPKRIGMAMPGPFDYQKGISYIKGFQKYEALYGLNIKEALVERLAIESNTILLENDAACFLRGEIFMGSAMGFRKPIGFTLGTGFGSAIAENGIVKDAEFWGKPFLNGMAEDYFSTKWFLKRYRELSGKEVLNVRELSTQFDTCSSARQVFHEFSTNLIAFSEEVISSYQPDIIVVGGNVTKARNLFFDQMINHFKKQNKSLTIRISQLGEEAAIIGGASLWKKHNLSTVEA